MVPSNLSFRRWCVEGFDWYHELNTKHDPAKTGVSRVTGYQLKDGITDKVGTSDK